ncbi:MAG: amino acid adenylation domain-containing protein, partial [Bacteroidetes bacterium]|nr:amino acid adenylation domain-containing protein [Bacteroidota bacterium]
RMDYNSERYSEGLIGSVLSCLERIIEVIADKSENRIRDISLLNEAELTLQEAYNNTHTSFPDTSTVVELFERCALAQPEAIALLEGETQVSYGELQAQSDAIAHLLVHVYGIGAGKAVGVLLERSTATVAILLGILKTGAAYIPMDIAYPPARVSAIVEDAAMTLLITETKDIAMGMNESCRSADATSLIASSATYQNQPSLNAATPDGLAYIIYTSGSTGKPKGVMVEHRSLMNYLWWALQYYLQGEPSVFALHTSLAFDLTVTSLFVPLISGNRMVIYREVEGELPVERVFSDNIATVIKLTPSHLKIIRESELQGLQSIPRKLIIGGEQLEQELANAIVEKLGTATIIYNEYGPTEATVGCMIYRHRREDFGYAVPVGRPVWNNRLYMLDRYMNEVPDGVAGELYIGGDSLARGYYQNEGLTAERFIGHPRKEGERIYKTGDLVRRMATGEIEYLGRIDEQVKIRGFRIELGEIEYQLNSYADIQESVVIAREEGGLKYLTGYYVSPVNIEPATLGNHAGPSGRRHKYKEKFF